MSGRTSLIFSAFRIKGRTTSRMRSSPGRYRATRASSRPVLPRAPEPASPRGSSNIDVGPLGSGKTVERNRWSSPPCPAPPVSSRRRSRCRARTSTPIRRTTPLPQRCRSAPRPISSVDDRARHGRPERRFQLDLHDLGQQPRALGCHRRDGLFAGAQPAPVHFRDSRARGRQRAFPERHRLGRARHHSRRAVGDRDDHGRCPRRSRAYSLTASVAGDQHDPDPGNNDAISCRSRPRLQPTSP